MVLLRWILAVIGAVAAWWSLPLHAANEATLEAVQWPVWIERAGQQQPAQPGMVLQSNDRLLTGKSARVLVRLADGSAVKLGEQASFGVSEIRREGEFLQAVLDASKGAFRFTTGLFNKVLGKRDVKIRVPNATLGVRGTDLWGKAEGDGYLVLLIEGRITVADGAGDPQEMAKALEYQTGGAGRATQRQSAEASQIKVWAAETEVDTARPHGSTRGKASAMLAKGVEQAAALALYDGGRRAGYPVRLSPVGDGRFDVRVSGLTDRRHADALVKAIEASLQGLNQGAPAR